MIRMLLVGQKLERVVRIIFMNPFMDHSFLIGGRKGHKQHRRRINHAKIKNGVFDDLFVFKAYLIAPCPTHEALGPNNPNNEQWINNRKQKSGFFMSHQRMTHEKKNAYPSQNMF